MGLLQVLGLSPRTEAERIRDERVARAREDLARHRQDLAQIRWGSNGERRISQVERDETLAVIRNKRISFRAQERTLEALVEGTEIDPKNTDAVARIRLLREYLRR